MNVMLAPRSEALALTALVDRASAALVGARNAAEVLDARDQASFAYDTAKKTARLMKAKRAHDDLIAAAYRAQADALEIEAGAKRRLADEYDAAQDRGELRADRERTASNAEAVGASDIGLTHKEIHEARIIRDAEVAEPGIVRRALDAALDAGEEPTKAKVKRATADVIHLPRASRGPPAKGQDAICAKVAEALVVLSGLPPAKEVGAYLRSRDEAVIVTERLRKAFDWIMELSEIWEKPHA